MSSPRPQTPPPPKIRLACRLNLCKDALQRLAKKKTIKPSQPKTQRSKRRKGLGRSRDQYTAPGSVRLRSDEVAQGSIQLKCWNLQGKRQYHLPVLSMRGKKKSFTYLQPLWPGSAHCMAGHRGIRVLAALASLLGLCLPGAGLLFAPEQVHRAQLAPLWPCVGLCMAAIEWSAPIWSHLQLSNIWKEWGFFFFKSRNFELNLGFKNQT